MFRNDHPIAVVVAARRVGRIVFGLALIAGVFVFAGRLAGAERPHAALTLAAVWAVAIVAGLAASRVARAIGWRAPDDRLFRASMMLPAAGAALLAPLTVHMLVAVLFGAAGSDFDEWAQVSVLAVGLAHGGFALAVMIRAVRAVDGAHGPSIAAIFCITILLSLFPFGLWLLPPVIVAVTGLPVAPAILLIDWTVKRERTLAAGPEPLPRAVALALRDETAA